MSDSTKYIFARSLYKLLDEKPLDKITITDLTKKAGLNRQTFYYHFHDIYALIEWIYTTAAEDAIGSHRTYQTWQEGLQQELSAMIKDKDFLLKTYHSKSGGHLADIVLNLMYELLTEVINEIAAGYPVSEEKKKFIADFYKYAYGGIIMQWVDEGMVREPAELVTDFELIMNGNILNAMKRYNAEERRRQYGI